MRLASWVQKWIIPVLYCHVDLWNEAQATSFLSAIESEGYTIPSRTTIRSLAIKTAAFSAYDTQDIASRQLPQVEAGIFAPSGVTGLTTFKIMAILNSPDSLQWSILNVPMTILATRRYVSQGGEPPLALPYSVTMTGVDGILWSAFDWNRVTRLRLTHYNPTFSDTRFISQLPCLTHLAIAIYCDTPICVRIAEELSNAPQLRCIVMVVFPLAHGGIAAARIVRRELVRLDDPKLVVWEPISDLLRLFEGFEDDALWGRADAWVDQQTIEKQLAIGADI